MGITLQKIAGGLLLALILVTGINMFGKTLFPEQVLESPAIAIATPEGEAPAGAAEEEAPPPFPVLLANATVEDGQKAARKCASCHTFEQGGPNRVGPNLYNTVGANIAGHEGFAYSNALANMGGTWTYEDLDAFLRKPAEYAPGTKMTFAGISNPEERAALIIYMKSLSPNAPPLPEQAAEAE